MHLYSWFSADTQIVRYLKQDNITEEQHMMNSSTLKQAMNFGIPSNQNLILDLYPQRQFDVYYNYDQKQEKANNRSEQKLSVSPAQRLQQMLGMKQGQMKSIKSERNVGAAYLPGPSSFMQAQVNQPGSHSLIIEQQRNSYSFKQ